jgi:predicted RNA methylase
VPFDFAAAYGDLNPDDSDYTFYTGLASRLSASRAVDLGWGTGTLAVRLACADLDVIGIDPDPDMLRVARQQPGSERVVWQLGYADSMPQAWADLVTMSGHVCQVFITDADWHLTLRAVATSTRNSRTGATTTDLETLAFRDQRDLHTDLEDCGFQVSDIFGDWDRSAAGAGSPELIVVARRKP